MRIILSIILRHYPGGLRKPTGTFRCESKAVVVCRIHSKYPTAMLRSRSIRYVKYISHKGVRTVIRTVIVDTVNHLGFKKNMRDRKLDLFLSSGIKVPSFSVQWLISAFLRTQLTTKQDIFINVQSMFFHQCERSSFTPTQSNRKNCGLICFNLHIFNKGGRTKNSESNRCSHSRNLICS